jgi:diadenosine tetraphosphate (Ap4A) HIT family hydrolase
MSFELHEKLAADTFEVMRLEVCQVLLMNDARFPWLILVPQIAGLCDWHEIPAAHQTQVLNEVNAASASLQSLTGAQKMNVASLGNQVPQLHIHIIARFEADAAWPKPVWSEGTPERYSASARDELAASLRAALG